MAFIYNPDLYGSLTDWLMLAVTIVTARYLWLTLQSQSMVQKLQQQTTNIENERFRLEVQPNFSMSITKNNIKIVDDNVEIALILDCQLLQADCRNLTVKNSSMFGEITLSHFLPSENEVVGVEAHRLNMVCLTCKKTMFDLTGMNIFTQFKFSDVIGNKYSQSIILYLTYTEQRVDIVKPIVHTI